MSTARLPPMPLSTRYTLPSPCALLLTLESRAEMAARMSVLLDCCLRLLFLLEETVVNSLLVFSTVGTLAGSVGKRFGK